MLGGKKYEKLMFGNGKF